MSFYSNFLHWRGGVNSTQFLRENISSENYIVKRYENYSYRNLQRKSSMSNYTQKLRKRQILEILQRICTKHGLK